MLNFDSSITAASGRRNGWRMSELLPEPKALVTTVSRPMWDIDGYVRQVVYPLQPELAGRRAEAIIDQHRLFDVSPCKI